MVRNINFSDAELEDEDEDEDEEEEEEEGEVDHWTYSGAPVMAGIMPPTLVLLAEAHIINTSRILSSQEHRVSLVEDRAPLLGHSQSPEHTFPL